jgi:very-short-patch-repair endonuclease
VLERSKGYMKPLHAPLTPDQRLSSLADTQEGVVHIAQLYELGFSLAQVKLRVRRGSLHQLYRGVYAVGRRRLSVRGRLLAAWFAAGPASFFSGRTAAAIRQLAPINLARIELTIPVGHTPSRTGLVLHRTRSAINFDVSPIGGLPTATVARLLVEVSAKATAAQVEDLIAAAVRNDTFDPLALEVAIQRHKHRRGVALLKEVADYYRPLPDRKSELERMFDREHARRPEIPPCQRNVIIGGWEIDCHWPQQRVALELDGRRYHTAVQDFDKDRRKDTALQLLHLKPMRASYWMWVRDKELVIADLLALLALGA